MNQVPVEIASRHATAEQPASELSARSGRWPVRRVGHRSTSVLGRLGRTAVVLLPALIGAGVWELYARSGDRLIAPRLGEIWSAFFDLIDKGVLVDNTGRTLSAMGIGLALSVGAGVPIGLLQGRSEVFDAVVGPYSNLMLNAPLVALTPIFVMVFESPHQAIVAVVVVYCLFPLAENARTGAAMLDPSLLSMAATYGASRWKRTWAIVLPAAVPLIASGLKVSVGRAFRGVILGEVLITLVGLGGRIKYYGQGYRMAHLYALTGAIVVIAVIFVLLAGVLERLVLRRSPR